MNGERILVLDGWSERLYPGTVICATRSVGFG